MAPAVNPTLTLPNNSTAAPVNSGPRGPVGATGTTVWRVSVVGSPLALVVGTMASVVVSEMGPTVPVPMGWVELANGPTVVVVVVVVVLDGEPVEMGKAVALGVLEMLSGRRPGGQTLVKNSSASVASVSNGYL